MEEPNKINNQKCLSTLPTNMPYLSLDNKVPITTTLPILKVLLKKYGNIVVEFSMKENTKISINKKIKNSKT